MSSGRSSFAHPLTSLGELPAAASITRAWGRLRLMRLEGGPSESPDFRLLHHFVALNLGNDSACEVRVEDGPWTKCSFSHHFFIFIPAGVQHAARGLPNKVMLLEVGAQFGESVLKACGDGVVFRPLICVEDDVVAHIMLALADEARGAGPQEQVHTEALGTALISRLALHGAAAPPPQAAGALSAARLHRVLDHVAGHLDAPPSLSTLADLAGMELFRFVRAFKCSTGLSPHRYVLDARITHAKDLLRNRALSITDAAIRTGFATPSHFAVTFRRLTGMSPGEFRRTATRAGG
jgi:AraC family transcriptional regulator